MDKEWTPKRRKDVRRFLRWAAVCLGFPFAVFVLNALTVVLHFDLPRRLRADDLWEYYFYIPAFVFRGKHFSGEKVCYIPFDIIGAIETVCLYLALAFCVASIHGMMARTWRRQAANKASQVADRKLAEPER